MNAVIRETVETRKKYPDYVRRTARDHSEFLRRTIQFAFLALNLWLGYEFVLFVRHFESPGAPAFPRPAGIEGWLPIAGLMNTKYWIVTGMAPVAHPAAAVLIAAFFAISLLLRKAFCSWLCPVGTISEYLWRLGQETFKRNFVLPRWLDISLRSLKYVLLGLFAYVVVSMPARALAEFLESPYGIVADVKMLNFFRYMTATTAIVLGVLVVASVFVKNFWCRYLCPCGALMGLGALLSPLRIRREPARCIDCAKCAKACPSQLPVDVLVQIRSAECLGCMECVAACPAEGALNMKVVGAGTHVRPWMIAAGCAVVFFGLVGAAKLTGHWDTVVACEVYRELVPRAREFVHP
ncbi:MAG TPA: 4Fe-4S binding protein [Bryobacteraceae bacterium]|nr:4Fe-4S binding protein [Bryobacteraceae bacterium]HPT28866.1 4Fe-4S binding protein [Bryobacteraceae bacterium]